MSLPKVYTLSRLTRFKHGKPDSRGRAEKHFHMPAEARRKADFPTEQSGISGPRVPAVLEEEDGVFLVDSWMGALVKIRGARPGCFLRVPA